MPPAPVVRMSGRQSICAALLVVAGPGCSDALTVDQLDPASDGYIGDVVRVRGRPLVVTTRTTARCSPPACACNGSFSELFLTGDDDPELRIALPEFAGSGDECHTRWPLSHPRHDGMELVGKLIRVASFHAPFALVEVSLDESKVLVGSGSLETMSFESFDWGPSTCGCPEASLVEACARPWACE